MSSETGFIFGEDRRPDRGPLYDYWGTRRSCRSTETQYGHYESPGRWLSRQVVGVVSFMLAVFTGMVLSNANFVQTVDAGGRQAIVMSPPGTAFWWAIVLGVLAVLLLTYATGGGR